MPSLIFIESVGPLEGAIYTAHRFAHDDCLVFDVNNEKFLPLDTETPELPTYVSSKLFSGRHILRSRYFEKICRDRGITSVYSIGLQASRYASVLFESIVVRPIIPRGDLDFSLRRKHLVRAFRDVVRRSDKLALADHLEMNKASSLGSLLPHLLTDAFFVNNYAVLRKEGSAKIAIVSPTNPSDKVRQQAKYFARELEIRKIDFVQMSAGGLYGRSDLIMGRHLPGTMKYRIGDCTHVVILGNDRNYASVLPQLLQQPTRIFVDDTLGNLGATVTNKVAYKARGRALLDLMLRTVTSHEDTLEETFKSPSAAEYLDILDSKFKAEVPWHYEEGLESNRPVDVFFTVAAIEDRANGARPQRIRNMYEVVAGSKNSIVITSNQRVLSRKIEQLKDLKNHSGKIRYFYGENSTSPMSSYDVLAQFEEVLNLVKSLNGTSYWFVRDLHWLDESIPLGNVGQSRETLVARGLREFDIASSGCDFLLAPDEHSISGFETLLARHITGSRHWLSMPPGVSLSNVVEYHSDSSSERFTLVYAGGANVVYGMPEFMESLLQLMRDSNLCFGVDFLIREDEVQDFVAALSSLGLDDDSRVRVLSTDFEDYLPRSRCIGVILLSSDYARFSFPYKTMSMLEKSMPIVTFSDMAISDFIVKNNLGLIVDRDSDSITTGIRSIAALSSSDFEFGVAQDKNLWDRRFFDLVSS